MLKTKTYTIKQSQITKDTTNYRDACFRFAVQRDMLKGELS